MLFATSMALGNKRKALTPVTVPADSNNDKFPLSNAIIKIVTK